MYKNKKEGYEALLPDRGLEYRDYIAVSQPTEITIVPLDKEEVVRSKIDHLESKVQEAKAREGKAAEEVRALTDKIQSLKNIPDIAKWQTNLI